MNQIFTSSPNLSLLIAIPCFNEQSTIADLLESIPREFAGVSSFTVVVIDDGSTDSTREIADAKGAIVITHPTNLGLGAAFRNAVEYALEFNFDLLLTIDADGQFNPLQISNLLESIQSKDFDVVSGSRFLPGSEALGIPRVRIIGNRIYSILISNLANISISDSSCGFRVYSKKALYHLSLTGGFTYTHESLIMLGQQGLKISEIPIEVKYFGNRNSTLTSNLFLYALKTLKIAAKTYFFYAPARVFFYVGNIFTLLTVTFGFMFIYHKLTTGTFAGYFFAGALAAVLGVIGLLCYTASAIALVLRNILKQQSKLLSLTKQIFFREQ